MEPCPHTRLCLWVWEGGLENLEVGADEAEVGPRAVWGVWGVWGVGEAAGAGGGAGANDLVLQEPL